MKELSLCRKILVPVLLCGLLPLMSGCVPSTRSSQTPPKIDSCKGVPKIVWGPKGELRPEAFDLANCYDWIIQRK